MYSYLITVNRNTDISKFLTPNHLEVGLSKSSFSWKQFVDLVSKSNYKNVTDVMADMFEVAMVTSIADRYFSRGEREEWVRNIEIQIDLREPARFEHIKPSLELALNLLGADNVSFKSSQLKESKFLVSSLKFKKDKNELAREAQLLKITNIALLSGGQDSSINVIEYLSQKAHPFFVRIDTRDKANPKSQIKKVLRKYKQQCFYMKFDYSQPNLNKDVVTEKSQRLRSFFFLIHAVLVGEMIGSKKININENGIMAVHLPLDPSRSSTFSTRTAYPPFLAELETVVRNWLNSPDLKISNNLILKTKKEVIDIAIKHGLEGVAISSVSCAHAATVSVSKVRNKKKAKYINPNFDEKHCGYCFPCILRRVSMSEAGLGDKDDIYLYNPFGEIFSDPDAKDYDFIHESKSAIISLIRFCRFFLNSSKMNILKQYPQIYEVACSIDTQSAIDEIIDLHRRFSIEVKSYIDKNAPHLSFFFNDSMSAHVESQILEIFSYDYIDSFLTERGVLKSGNDKFVDELESLYSEVRFKVLLGLANGKISPDQVKQQLLDAIESYLPKKEDDLKRLNLKQSSGREIAKKANSSCKCPPLTGK